MADNKIVDNPDFDTEESAGGNKKEEENKEEESNEEEQEGEEGEEESEEEEGDKKEKKEEKDGDDADDGDDKSDDEEGEEEEESDKKDEEEEEDIGEEGDEKKQETGAGKLYHFNGKTLTADELFAEASGLQVDHTQKSQDLAKKEAEEILAKYKPEEVEGFKKLASALGFVSKDELDKDKAVTTQKGIVTQFLKTHPEYTKAKDPKGEKYAKLQSQLGKYNLSLDNLEWALNKAHDDLSGGKNDATARQLAKVTQIKRSGVHGGGSGGGGKKGSQYTPQQIAVMKKMGVYDEKE